MEIVETGTPEEIFDRPRQERTRRFLDKIPRLNLRLGYHGE
jgi:ABC-type dipeptide/oligopeptide/nickel transport system ATPase component